MHSTPVEPSTVLISAPVDVSVPVWALVQCSSREPLLLASTTSLPVQLEKPRVATLPLTVTPAPCCSTLPETVELHSIVMPLLLWRIVCHSLSALISPV